MAGPRRSPWTSLLLAALLSVSFPGDMGELKTPLSSEVNFQGTALTQACSRVSCPDTHSAVQQTTTTHFFCCCFVF